MNNRLANSIDLDEAVPYEPSLMDLNCLQKCLI